MHTDVMHNTYIYIYIYIYVWHPRDRRFARSVRARSFFGGEEGPSQVIGVSPKLGAYIRTRPMIQSELEIIRKRKVKLATPREKIKQCKRIRRVPCVRKAFCTGTRLGYFRCMTDAFGGHGLHALLRYLSPLLISRSGDIKADIWGRPPCSYSEVGGSGGFTVFGHTVLNMCVCVQRSRD